MYNVKGPSKIVAKTTRRGMAQNLDTYRDHTRNKSVESEEGDYATNNSLVYSVPKPVFHNTAKRSATSPKQEEAVSPQQEEIIKYIHDSWSTVCSEMEQKSTNDSSSGDGSIVFYEDDPCPELQDFKPFDLESWWGKRLYIHITSSVNSKS